MESAMFGARFFEFWAIQLIYIQLKSIFNLVKRRNKFSITNEGSPLKPIYYIRIVKKIRNVK